MKKEEEVEMFNFEIEPDITSQCISNHTSGIIVV